MPLFSENTLYVTPTPALLAAHWRYTTVLSQSKVKEALEEHDHVQAAILMP